MSRSPIQLSAVFVLFLSFVVLLIPGKYIKRVRACTQPDTSVLMLDCCEENNADRGRPDALKYLNTSSRQAAARFCPGVAT